MSVVNGSPATKSYTHIAGKKFGPIAIVKKYISITTITSSILSRLLFNYLSKLS